MYGGIKEPTAKERKDDSYVGILAGNAHGGYSARLCQFGIPPVIPAPLARLPHIPSYLPPCLMPAYQTLRPAALGARAPLVSATLHPAWSYPFTPDRVHLPIRLPTRERG